MGVVPGAVPFDGPGVSGIESRTAGPWCRAATSAALSDDDDDDDDDDDNDDNDDNDDDDDDDDNDDYDVSPVGAENRLAKIVGVRV